MHAAFGLCQCRTGDSQTLTDVCKGRGLVLRGARGQNQKPERRDRQQDHLVDHRITDAHQGQTRARSHRRHKCCGPKPVAAGQREARPKPHRQHGQQVNRPEGRLHQAVDNAGGIALAGMGQRRGCDQGEDGDKCRFLHRILAQRTLTWASS